MDHRETLAPQFSEKLPNVRHHQFGLFPKGEMASVQHLRVMHQITISLENIPGRIKTWIFARQGGLAGRNRNFTSNTGVVDRAAVHPDRGTHRIAYEV